MDDLFQANGEQIFILESRLSDRVKRVIAGLIAAGVLGALASIPLLASDRTSLFFWGLAILGWLIGAAALTRMLVALVTSRGIIFDRERGTAVVWRTRLGSRRETLHSLKPFDSLHLSTWMRRMEGTRRGYMVQVYDLELRGPTATLLLEEISDAKGYASQLADFLKLPLVSHDDHSGGKRDRGEGGGD